MFFCRSALVSALVASLNVPVAWARDISLVVKGDLSPYEARFMSGAAQAGTNLGVNIKVFSPSVLTNNNLVVLLKRLVSEPNKSGIVVEVPWSPELGTLLQKENIHGNIIWTSRLSGPFSDATNFVTWDDAHTSAVAADALATAIKTSDGKIEGHVLLVSQSSSAVEDNAAQGFKRQLAEHYPDLKLIDTGSVMFKPESSQSDNELKDKWKYAAEQAMSSFLTADQNVVGVFASDPELTTGAAHAIANTKNKGKIALVGADLFVPANNRSMTITSLYSGWNYWLTDIIAASGSGQSQFIVQDSFTLGYQSVKAAFAASQGDYSQQAQYLETAMAISGNEFQSALTNWSEGSGPGLVADPRVIPILYTTNRN
jgi:ABC-type sugar transport system substrate-binding protein